MMKTCRSIPLAAEFLFLSVLSLGLSGVAHAEDKPAPALAAAPSQDEAMKVWIAMATPGAPHKALEAFAGTWDVRTKAWMAPGAPPMETTGSAENRMILGGRFLEQHYEATMMGRQPFSGNGVAGFDNYKKKFVSTWIDSMSTAVMVTQGTFDKAGKVLTASGTMDDVVAKKPFKIKTKVTLLDADHHTYELWRAGPDGKMVKDLEVQYTRKK